MAQLNHVYEDFEPTTEWLRDAGYDTLLVYLPGFKKEQLKVQVTPTKNLKIFGERPLGDNKFSRFRKELRIPLDYESNQITAKFEGGILKIKHPKSISPATKLQENANSSAENQELQKPANEVKDQKHEQEQAAQEVPQKNKIENEKKTNGNNTNENIAASEKEELRVENGKNITAATDAHDVSGKFSNNDKTDGLVDEGKIVSNEHEKGQEIKGSGESKLVYYKQVFGGLVTEMKKPRKSTNMVVAVGLLVLLLGFYVKKSTIKSGESEN